MDILSTPPRIALQADVRQLYAKIGRFDMPDCSRFKCASQSGDLARATGRMSEYAMAVVDEAMAGDADAKIVRDHGEELANAERVRHLGFRQ